MRPLQVFKWTGAAVVYGVAIVVLFNRAQTQWGFSMEGFLSGLLPLILIGWILFATRRKPGHRYEKKPPGQAEADLDNWTGWG